MACGGSCGCDDCATAPRRVRASGAACVLAPHSVATTPLHPCEAAAPRRRRFDGTSPVPSRGGVAEHRRRVDAAGERRRAVERTERAAVTPPLFADPIDDASYVAPPGSPPRMPERRALPPKPTVTPPGSRAPMEPSTPASEPRSRIVDPYLRFLPELQPGGRGKGGGGAADDLLFFPPSLGGPTPTASPIAPRPSCPCVCECRDPDDADDRTFPSPVVTPPQFAPFLATYAASGSRSSGPVTGPVEARTDLVSIETVAIGPTPPVTTVNAASQFAGASNTRALAPFGTAGSSGAVHPPTGSLSSSALDAAGSGRSTSISSAPTTASLHAASSPTPASPADPLAGFPEGAYVNPRPGAWPSPTTGAVGSVASLVGEGSGLDRGAGRGAFVNVRPDFGLDRADGEPLVPPTSLGVGPIPGGAGGLEPWTWLDHRPPPNSNPPNDALTSPSKGSAQSRLDDESARMPPGTRYVVNPTPKPTVAARAGLRPGGSISRALFPPMFPGPGDRFHAPGGTFSTIGPQRADLLRDPNPGRSLGAGGARRPAASGLRPGSPPALGGAATPRTPDATLVDAPLMRTPSTEQSLLDLGRKDPHARPIVPAATATIDGSLGAPTMPPRRTAAPPLHPALSPSGPPLVVAANALATPPPAPAPRTTVVVAPASIAGRGVGGATSVFTARPQSSAGSAGAASAGTSYAPAPSTVGSIPALRLGQAPEATIATDATIDGATPRRTAAPEGSRGGPAVPNGTTGVPLLPESPARRGEAGLIGTTRSGDRAQRRNRAAPSRWPPPRSSRHARRRRPRLRSPCLRPTSSGWPRFGHPWPRSARNARTSSTRSRRVPRRG